MAVYASHISSQPQAVQQKLHITANSNSVTQLNAGVPGAESFRTGPTSCHSVPWC
jgi:uncharacterized caspase-like protein